MSERSAHPSTIQVELTHADVIDLVQALEGYVGEFDMGLRDPELDRMRALAVRLTREVLARLDTA